MEANELRIGNKALLNGIIIDVTARLILEQHQSDITNHGYLDHIQLTEEWLIHFGFEKSIIHSTAFGDIEIFNKGNFCLAIRDGKIVYFIDCEDREYVEFGREVEYVHTLQNLYFALEDTELI